ncbi:hypothetical protein N9878_00695, partial [bacterium]|nr:hypothetical protein [bacterium]
VNDMNIKSRRGAVKRYNALVNKAYRELSGGTQYGIDMPTLAIVLPEIHSELKHIKSIWAGLPE